MSICRERHRSAAEMRWSERDRAEGMGAYNRRTRTKEFERWFYEDSGFEDDGVHIVLERIPESLRGLF